ncbi:MAG: DUF5131 family protein [Alphaproteobacteria bacterium]|nr:DUF5131 family protein [Alphaproteobacteria bacterium]
MSAIEWTDHTVNVQIGCSRVSPGCERCYAETQANALARRFGKPGQPGHRYLPVVDGKGRWSRKVVLDNEALDRPPHGPTPFGHGIPRRKRDGCRWRAPRVFLGSMTDHFHESVNEDKLANVLEWMALAPTVVWQLVTKRPERAASMLEEASGWGWGAGRLRWPTIHLLATVEDQARADERVPQLVRAAPYVDLVGLSVEPLLGPVTIPVVERLGWIIVGGESGRGARPCDLAWIRSIVTQCHEAGVPIFVKQLGAEAEQRATEVSLPETIGLNHPKGGDWTEWPADLRIREWPRSRLGDVC